MKLTQAHDLWRLLEQFEWSYGGGSGCFPDLRMEFSSSSSPSSTSSSSPSEWPARPPGGPREDDWVELKGRIRWWGLLTPLMRLLLPLKPLPTRRDRTPDLTVLPTYMSRCNHQFHFHNSKITYLFLTQVFFTFSLKVKAI